MATSEIQWQTGRKWEDEILHRVDCIEMEQKLQQVKKQEEGTWKKKGCSWGSQEGEEVGAEKLVLGTCKTK